MHLGLFLDILECYLFFVRQKHIIEDKDEAISQLASAVEEKIHEVGESEEIKTHLNDCRNRWEELSKKCKEA